MAKYWNSILGESAGGGTEIWDNCSPYKARSTSLGTNSREQTFTSRGVRSIRSASPMAQRIPKIQRERLSTRSSVIRPS